MSNKGESLPWLVAELLAADGCLGHQAASWKGEDDDALPIFSVQCSALCRRNSGNLCAHFKMAFFKICERLGGLEENHFVEGPAANLRAHVYFRQCGFADPNC